MKRKKLQKHHQAKVKDIPMTAKASDPESWKYYGALAVILLVSFIVYFPVLNNSLLNWDDEGYIKNNPLIYSINLKEIFSRNVLGNYHPLTILTLAAEYQIFGLNETGYHAVNLLLHLLNVLLVFYTVFLLSEKGGIALVAALLFAIHPMHVESVAWAAELKDLLYTFFFLASYIFYLKYLKDPNRKHYLFALLLFTCSLLSKAMAASLPVLLLLTDYFKGRKINGKVLLEKAPFFFLAIVFGIVAIMAQKYSGSVDVYPYTFLQRFFFASFGFISYLFKLLMPLNLSAYYPYPLKNGVIDIPIRYYAYILLFVGLAVYIIHSTRFSKKIFFGMGFFAVTVFLVLQFVPIGGAIMADRYVYIPSIGVFYLAGEGFYLLWSKGLKFATIIILSAFTLLFSIKTYARCIIWNNDMSIWNDVIDQNPNTPAAYANRGILFMNEKKYDRALEDFNKAIEIRPNNAKAYNFRGVLLLYGKKYDGALEDYCKAIELYPNYAEAYNNRGVLFEFERKYDMAFADYNRAIELDRNFAKAYLNRGILLKTENKYDRALADYGKAIELNPGFIAAYTGKGDVLFELKRYEEAFSAYTKAIVLKGDDAQAWYKRGIAGYYSGRRAGACSDLKKAGDLGYKPAAAALAELCK